MLVKFESERTEWEHNADLLKNGNDQVEFQDFSKIYILAEKEVKEKHQKEKSDWEAKIKKLMVIIKRLDVTRIVMHVILGRLRESSRRRD